MSRSYAHTPIATICSCKSQKWDKQKANRRFRRAERTAMASGRYDRIPCDMNEIASTWDFVGDGKTWYGHEMLNTKYFRK